MQVQEGSEGFVYLLSKTAKFDDPHDQCFMMLCTFIAFYINLTFNVFDLASFWEIFGCLLSKFLDAES